MMMTAATIPTFSGADPAYPAARWVEDFSDNAEVCGWSPPQKLLIARRVLTGVAGLWLRTENKFKSFEELQRALLDEFPDKVHTKHNHKLMTNCERKMAASAKEETRGERPTYVSVKQDPDQRQSSGYRCQSEMSVKQESVMFEVRMDEATNMSNDYSKETEVTAIKTKENENNKCHRQCHTDEVNKQVLESKKEKSFKIKEEKIFFEHKVEEVTKIVEEQVEKVEEQVEKVEEKVEKVVKKEHFPGEFPSLVKEKYASTRRYTNDWINNRIPYEGDKEKIMVLGAMKQEISKRVHENYFPERIIKEEISKDYHILR